MNNEQLKSFVLAIAGEAEIVEGKQYLTALVYKINFTTCQSLKESETQVLTICFCLTGMDWVTVWVWFFSGINKHKQLWF